MHVSDVQDSSLNCLSYGMDEWSFLVSCTCLDLLLLRTQILSVKVSSLKQILLDAKYYQKEPIDWINKLDSGNLLGITY